MDLYFGEAVFILSTSGHIETPVAVLSPKVKIFQSSYYLDGWQFGNNLSWDLRCLGGIIDNGSNLLKDSRVLIPARFGILIYSQMPWDNVYIYFLTSRNYGLISNTFVTIIIS